jgi:hypothetical protein
MKGKEILLMSLLSLMLAVIRCERYCGYKGDLSKKIQGQLDDCFAKNVLDSRVKMAVGFEHCFGYNYEKLNSTVEAPFVKRLNDTNRHVVHLAFKICDDKDNNMEDSFYMIDAQGTSISDLTGPSEDRTPENQRSCKSFFQRILDSLAAQNFEVDSVIESNEKLIAVTIPNSDNRGKLFTIIKEIVRPLGECRIPMVELRASLIKKYLKQFLVAQINPSLPSFTSQSYNILMHPEYSMAMTSSNLGNDFSDSADDKPKPSIFSSNLLGSKRTVVLRKRTDTQKLSKSEKKDVLSWDEDNKDKSPQEKDAMIREDLADGKPKKITKLMMTPAQKLKMGLISKSEYDRIVDLTEDHSHQPQPIEVDKFWDSNLLIKKKRFNNEDFSRYKINGFDIDQKIQQLFKTI